MWDCRDFHYGDILPWWKSLSCITFQHKIANCGKTMWPYQIFNLAEICMSTADFSTKSNCCGFDRGQRSAVVMVRRQSTTVLYCNFVIVSHIAVGEQGNSVRLRDVTFRRQSHQSKGNYFKGLGWKCVYEVLVHKGSKDMQAKKVCQPMCPTLGSLYPTLRCLAINTQHNLHIPHWEITLLNSVNEIKKKRKLQRSTWYTSVPVSCQNFQV